MGLKAEYWGGAVLLVFYLYRALYRRVPWPIWHPVLAGTLTLFAWVEASGRAYAAFGEGTSFLSWLLGPAVVALAVPVYRLRHLIASHVRPLLVLVPFALFFGVISMGLTLHLCAVSLEVIRALSLKSVTVPITLEILREMPGGLTPRLQAIAALGTMFASVMGGSLGPWVLRRVGITDAHALGFTLGATSHGVGTARAYELGPIEGAYASVGMICSGICAALIMPWLLAWG